MYFYIEGTASVEKYLSVSYFIGNYIIFKMKNQLKNSAALKGG